MGFRFEPSLLHVSDNATFTFTLTSKPSNFRIYDRENPHQNEAALREAVPRLYESFQP